MKKIAIYFTALMLGGVLFSVAYVLAGGFGDHLHHQADIINDSGGSGNFGVTTCPSGFSRVGPAGRRESFCISTDEETTAIFFTATNNCQDKDTGGQDYARMCTHDEWYVACRKGVDTGQPAFANSTDDSEWVADLATTNNAMLLGNGSCSTTNDANSNDSNVFRCCFR